jgi:hypothetical protein
MLSSGGEPVQVLDGRDVHLGDRRTEHQVARVAGAQYRAPRRVDSCSKQFPIVGQALVAQRVQIRPGSPSRRREIWSTPGSGPLTLLRRNMPAPIVRGGRRNHAVDAFTVWMWKGSQTKSVT